MSERERWIVYPLLFLALGAALRDKLFDRTTSKSIVCQELTVVDEQPIGQQPVRVLAKIGRSQSTAGQPPHGYLFVNGQLEVVDEVTAGRPPVPVLFTRTHVAPNSVPYGVVTASGQFNVDGVVNARQYALQGVPFLPALQSVFPLPTGDLLRALQQSMQQPGSARAPADPPPRTEDEEASPAAPATGQQRDDERSREEPAAD